MKNLLYILLLIPFGILAQTPQGFKYQAVIRTANGILVTNEQVAIKTSLISGSALGNVDYSEQHDVATNGYGVASFTIGDGTPITGTYSAVNWSANDYFLKTELDIQNNGNFQLMGTSQILSVPYASHANTATSSLVDNDTSATNEIQQLSLQGNQLILSGGGSVTLTGTVDLDADPSNELQTLSLSNDTLYLTNGNYVVLPPDSDADPSNELQTLANTAGTISISGSNTITLADSSSTNELQTLSQTAGSISISNGNTITILDSSATNELQSLTVIGQDSLMITNGNTVKIPSLDNSETNEIQNLSINQNTISISSGNSIDIPITPINNDNDSINELQMLSVDTVTNTISISNGNTISIDASFNNELQTLTYINDSLKISEGNSIKIINGKNYFYTEFFEATSSWICPQDVNKIFVELWGAAGGGGGGSGGLQGCMRSFSWWNGGYSLQGAAGGTGGSGGYNSKELKVTPGNTYSIIIGSGGLGGDSTICGIGGSGDEGDTTFFSNILFALGGIGGTGQSGTVGGVSSVCSSCIGNNGQVLNWKYPNYNSNTPSYIPLEIAGPVPGLASGGSFGTGGSGSHSGISTQPSSGDKGENGFCIIHY